MRPDRALLASSPLTSPTCGLEQHQGCGRSRNMTASSSTETQIAQPSSRKYDSCRGRNSIPPISPPSAGRATDLRPSIDLSAMISSLIAADRLPHLRSGSRWPATLRKRSQVTATLPSPRVHPRDHCRPHPRDHRGHRISPGPGKRSHARRQRSSGTFARPYCTPAPSRAAGLNR